MPISTHTLGRCEVIEETGLTAGGVLTAEQKGRTFDRYESRSMPTADAIEAATELVNQFGQSIDFA
jgi:hypothetical protein